MKHRTYEKETVETVARLWSSGRSMSGLSLELGIPYRTIVYWIKRLRAKGLVQEKRRTEKDKSFEEIVNDIRYERKDATKRAS